MRALDRAAPEGQAATLDPRSTVRTVPVRKVAIIGSGVAGLTAALSLAERGVPSLVLERERSLGGLCAQLGCKGVDRCVRCDSCLARDKVDMVKASPSIERRRGVEVVSLEGGAGDLRLLVQGSSSHREVLQVGAVICATGAEPFDPSLERRLGHGEMRDVVTSLELERSLASSGSILVPSTGMAPSTLAFVQCVGSRDARFAPYCSAYCCKSSFKLAQAVRAKHPSCRISFLFMDLRLHDPRENIRLWASGQEGVELVRSRPSEICAGEGGKPTVRFAAEGDAALEERAFDMVVLALALVPSPGAKDLARSLGVGLDDFGFMRSQGDAWTSTRPGVFLAGSCSGPKDIVASAKDGSAAATRALALLEGFR
ncbi:MAG: FAD-dependent oxidoreductase [Methanomassiliicoccales archaeon]|jgi:heterodisulfide reductase subunit A-like polyferredoxin|nr:FAD-dependent oxidoreductase [Methanomassiliicoccales archaeon]